MEVDFAHEQNGSDLDFVMGINDFVDELGLDTKRLEFGLHTQAN